MHQLQKKYHLLKHMIRMYLLATALSAEMEQVEKRNGMT